MLMFVFFFFFFFFSSRRRHTRFDCDWSSDVCSSDLSGSSQKFSPRGENFWLDPEIGPWGSPAAVYPEFARELVNQELGRYLEVCERSRDAIFNDTMPSGASGEELMRIQIPALIMSGADSRHTRSASWALKELMPQSELWEVSRPHQNGQNTLEQILPFKSRFETSGQAAYSPRKGSTGPQDSPASFSR